MRIEIIDNTEPKALSRRVWRFMDLLRRSDTLDFVLDYYGEQSRPSTRHRNWMADRAYVRLDSRLSNMSAEQVEIPVWVRGLVTFRATQAIRVVK